MKTVSSKRKALLSFLAGVAFVGLPAVASAQDAAASYPNKPIRLIVPFAPGGAADAMGRLVAEHLQSKWGQPVVIDNKPGAGSALGVGLLAKAPNDGYTIGMGNIAANAINPALQPALTNYQPVTDFSAVTMLGVTPLVLVVNAEKVPAKTLPEFIAFLKANPGKLAYGSSGSGTSLHIAMELFLQKTGTKMLHVPYKGSAPMMTDLLGGQVVVAIDAATTSWPQVQAGKLRALAVAGSEKAFFAPDLPLLSDQVAGFDMKPWHGLLAPAGTPPAIVNKISQEVRAFLRTPEAQAKFQDKGIVRAGSSPQEFQSFMAKELEMYKKIIADAGIKPE
ncbi:MAG: tripartite tricarboxylate transporter substrate binding protein [Burkholderiales bacterium]|nr:MAG: tripartite tricarboxylate transporter substrate binding protein [Burkholderiales bacterium]